MEPQEIEKLKQLEEKIDKIYVSVEQTRKYFLWTLIISVGAVVIPILGLIIIIPWVLGTLGNAYSGLGI